MESTRQISREIDVRIHGSGRDTILLFEPLTEVAREWIAENVGGETQWFAGALCVERRYAQALTIGMVADGLRLR